MADFLTSYFWPFVIIVAESLLMLVVLLVTIAFVLYADRKIWAAVQIRRGPNVVGPWGLLQSFADLLKFVLKEPVIPAGAACDLRPGACLLGGDPGQCRLGHSQH
jgi:NADH-quinone oxidoreductase subunit H